MITKAIENATMNRIASGRISSTRPVIRAMVRPAFSQNSLGRRSSAFSSDSDGVASLSASSNTVAAAPSDCGRRPRR
ncbi:hypothetical protein D3C80_1566280 [compost metagenome]